MAVSFGFLEELTLDEVAKEAGVPGTLEGDQPNLLRAWANALGGAARPSDIAGTPESVYSHPLPSGPSTLRLTPVPTGRAQPALRVPPRVSGRPRPSGSPSGIGRPGVCGGVR